MDRQPARSPWFWWFVVAIILTLAGGGGLLIGGLLYPDSNLLGGLCCFALPLYAGLPLLVVVTVTWLTVRVRESRAHRSSQRP